MSFLGSANFEFINGKTVISPDELIFLGETGIEAEIYIQASLSEEIYEKFKDADS